MAISILCNHKKKSMGNVHSWLLKGRKGGSRRGCIVSPVLFYEIDIVCKWFLFVQEFLFSHNFNSRVQRILLNERNFNKPPSFKFSGIMKLHLKFHLHVSEEIVWLIPVKRLFSVSNIENKIHAQYSILKGYLDFLQFLPCVFLYLLQKFS